MKHPFRAHFKHLDSALRRTRTELRTFDNTKRIRQNAAWRSLVVSVRHLEWRFANELGIRTGPTRYTWNRLPTPRENALCKLADIIERTRASRRFDEHHFRTAIRIQHTELLELRRVRLACATTSSAPSSAGRGFAGLPERLGRSH